MRRFEFKFKLDPIGCQGNNFTRLSDNRLSTLHLIKHSFPQDGSGHTLRHCNSLNFTVVVGRKKPFTPFILPRRPRFYGLPRRDMYSSPPTLHLLQGPEQKDILSTAAESHDQMLHVLLQLAVTAHNPRLNPQILDQKITISKST